MPKRTKPRKQNASLTTASLADTSSPRSARRKRIAKYASIAIVLALVATVLIGAVIAPPAKAAELSVVGGAASVSASSSVLAATENPAEPDTDGDGTPNNADSDIDGDGVVNGVDPDIDGDGVANGQDGDPAGTNGPVTTVAPTKTAKLPELIPAQFNTPTGRILLAGGLLAIGVGVIAARRKRK